MENVEKRQFRLPSAVHRALRQLAWLGAGFLLAHTRLFDGLPSFSLALAAAAPHICLPACCVGAAAGSMVFAPDLLTGLTGTAAILACGTISFALHTITGTQKAPLTAFLIAFLCCCTAGFTTLLACGFYSSGVLLYLCDGLLAGGAAYFLTRARTLLPLLQRNAVPGGEEALVLAAAVSVLLASAASWTVYVFVPARAAAAGVILLSAYLFAYTGGGTAGILCGAAMEIVCGLPGLSCCFALGGLLSGLCSRRGRALSALCMAAVSGFYPLLAQTNASVAVFAETWLACAVFCAVPGRVVRRLRRRIGTLTIASPSAAALRRRLYEASNAVSQIPPYLSAQQLRQGRAPGTQRMTKHVYALVCTDCARRVPCWETDEAGTLDALSEAFLLLHRKQYLSPDSLPEPLGTQCVRRNMLVAACVHAYEQTARHMPAAASFALACDLLEDAADRCGDEQQILSQESDAARQVFRAHGVAVQNVSCFAQRGRKRLTAESEPFPDTLNKSALTDALSRACGCTFSLPTVSAAGDMFRWQFVQTIRLRLRTGTAQAASDGKVCGDYFLTFARDGVQTLILCDGMGTGRAAQADAQAAAEIFASLLQAGVREDCAFRTLNSALLQREDVESVSTIDAVRVDLYTGEATFSKAGAAASYILHKGKSERVDAPCMPAGILPEAALAHATRTLHKGDAVVLVSDGACALHDEHILAALSDFGGGSAQKLAEDILRRSRKAYGKARADDSTVLTVVVE